MRVSATVLVGVALLLGVLGGCGGSDDSTEIAFTSAPEPATTQQPVLTPQEKAEARAKAKAAAKAEAAREKARGGWTGVDGDNYEIAKAACGAFPKEKLASEYGLSSSADEFEIAEAYSHEFVGRFQQANFEGCLAGMGIE